MKWNENKKLVELKEKEKISEIKEKTNNNKDNIT